MNFSLPRALILLVFVPYFIWLGRPRSRHHNWRGWLSLSLRILIILLIILGLAGTQLVRASDELAVVFLIDASDSISQSQFEAAESYVRESISQMGATDKAAVVVFGANALVERPMSGLVDLAPITTVIQPLNTDIAQAIRLGMALFPQGSARRLVLLSDGLATSGNTQKAASLAVASDVQIDAIPLEQPTTSPEAMLTAVDAPAQVNEGETFRIDITAESTINTEAILRVLSSSRIVHEDRVDLRPGTNRFSLQLEATRQEFARYTIQLEPGEDSYHQNNQLAAFTNITGSPRVLVIYSNDPTVEDPNNEQVIPDDASYLVEAIQAVGLNVDVLTPEELSPFLADLGDYSSVILANVNAKDLTLRKMEVLRGYVRDLGGGLVAIGGPDSYGMGGYFRTPLEEILPVDMQIKDQERFPSVSIAIVIDRSGSMAAEEGGLTKIQLAAEGAIRVVELLNDFDHITVIPIDTQADQTIGPASAADRDQIIPQIRLIGAGGGGIFVRTGLEAAAQALAQSSDQVKHIILLADGADSEQKEGVPELIGSLRQAGMTVSTVSIGQGPDVSWLEEMSTIGGGRFHLTDRASNLPQIFAQETTNIQRSYLVEERFFPSLSSDPFASNHLIMRALARGGITTVPYLDGYVATSPKVTAQVVLETHQADPLLASWEYGLGRTVAWTSDATSRWASAWIGWEGFQQIWSNIVRYSLGETRDAFLDTEFFQDRDRVNVTVDAQDRQGNLINNLNLEASVIDPRGESHILAMEQIGPGRYQGELFPEVEGAYLLRYATVSDAAQQSIGDITGWVLGYSPEYRTLLNDESVLEEIASMTGGRILYTSEQDSSQRPFDHNLPANRASNAIWPFLIGLAILLFPFDVAIRRLVITHRDLVAALAIVGSRFNRGVDDTVDEGNQVERLKEAKHRAGATERLKQSPGIASSENWLREPEVKTMDIDIVADKATETQSGGKKEDETLAARLLDKKRKQQSDSE